MKSVTYRADIPQILGHFGGVVKGRKLATFLECRMCGQNEAVDGGIEEGQGEHEVATGGARTEADGRDEQHEGSASVKRVQKAEILADADLPRPAVALEHEHNDREDYRVACEEGGRDLQRQCFGDEAQWEHQNHQQRVDHVHDAQVRQQPLDWRLAQSLRASFGRLLRPRVSFFVRRG